MSYAIIHQFKGGTKQQYEATLAVHQRRHAARGQTYHAAGRPPTADVFAVHDSKP